MNKLKEEKALSKPRTKDHKWRDGKKTWRGNLPGNWRSPNKWKYQIKKASPNWRTAKIDEECENKVQKDHQKELEDIKTQPNRVKAKLKKSTNIFEGILFKAECDAGNPSQEIFEGLIQVNTIP